MRERRLSGAGTLDLVPGVSLADGVLEADVAVTEERSFHGVVWRVEDERNYESFFVRPHQTGNPDAIQYTPVFNGVSAWQLYHGEGFWQALVVPIDEWFTIRVAFAEDRLQVHVAGELALPATRLRRPPGAGGVGLLLGGDNLRVAEVRVSDETPDIPAAPEEPRVAGTIERWQVSNPFAGDDLRAARTWTEIDAEPSGLLDLARVNGIDGGRDTVLARATIHAARPRRARLELGFSDAATVYLNGAPLFRGEDGYRSRDYRFLGSIGWHDTVYLPLKAGDNEIVVAVSERFGGWGVQARLLDV